MLLSTYGKPLLKNNATSFKNNFLAYSQGVLVNLSDIPILGYEKNDTMCNNFIAVLYLTWRWMVIFVNSPDFHYKRQN